MFRSLLIVLATLALSDGAGVWQTNEHGSTHRETVHGDEPRPVARETAGSLDYSGGRGITSREYGKDRKPGEPARGRYDTVSRDGGRHSYESYEASGGNDVQQQGYGGARKTSRKSGYQQNGRRGVDYNQRGGTAVQQQGYGEARQTSSESGHQQSGHRGADYNQRGGSDVQQQGFGRARKTSAESGYQQNGRRGVDYSQRSGNAVQQQGYGGARRTSRESGHQQSGRRGVDYNQRNGNDVQQQGHDGARKTSSKSGYEQSGRRGVDYNQRGDHGAQETDGQTRRGSETPNHIARTPYGSSVSGDTTRRDGNKRGSLAKNGYGQGGPTGISNHQRSQKSDRRDGFTRDRQETGFAQPGQERGPSSRRGTFTNGRAADSRQTVHTKFGARRMTKTGPRCYDCNYAPSGFVRDDRGWRNVTGEVGFRKCSLTGENDGNFLNNGYCASGRCFIRRDPNGLVFRGCADLVNLHLDVDPNKNCAYQGPSLWWFCRGDLCNTGQIGNANRCGVPPLGPRPGDRRRTDFRTTFGSGDGSGDTSSENGFGVGANAGSGTRTGTRAGTENGHGRGQDGRGQTGGRQGGFAQRRGGPGRKSVSSGRGFGAQGGAQGRTTGDRDRGIVDRRGGPRFGSRGSQGNGSGFGTGGPSHGSQGQGYCTGDCSDNPSGLLPDPTRKDAFIQCGCDFKNGKACTCCRPYFLPCPNLTEYDDKTKGCTIFTPEFFAPRKSGRARN